MKYIPQYKCATQQQLNTYTKDWLIKFSQYYQHIMLSKFVTDLCRNNYSMEQQMKVEIWSDVMCPFCYIGKRHFEKALEQFKHKDKVVTEWKSFQLDPSLPEENTNEDVYEYLSKRKGISKEQVKQMHKYITAMADNAGLTYNLDKTVMVNSFKAHTLIQLAKEKGFGDEAEEILFHANFNEGKDFSNTNVLINLGKQIGLSEADVQEALTNDKYAVKVNDDIQEASQLRISGVPFFVLNNRYGVSGAQPVEIFTQALEKAYEEYSANTIEAITTDTDAAYCKTDGSNC